jgi:hypothetical protein
MKNRDIVLRKIDSIDSNMNKLNFTLNRGDRDASYEIVESVRDLVSQLKTYIESEPIIGKELNKF